MKNIFLTLGLIILTSFFADAQNDTERPRTPLIEVFTSSTCPPCNGSNVNLKNTLNQYQGRFAMIKYQMNWPSTGDPYYTLEGNVRRNVYGVNSVPAIYLNGASSSISVTTLNNAQNIPAFIDMDIDYSLSGKTVNATVTLTPSMDMSNTNLRLYIAIVEKRTVNNKATNGETEFFQVMKKFMPDASGLAIGELVANTPLVFEEEWEFKGNYRKPNNANDPINHSIEHSVENFNNLMIVAWVQNTQTKAVLQSAMYPYSINFSTSDENGTISASVDGETIESGAYADLQTQVLFTATPNQWYEVREWRLNGTVVPGNTTNEYETVIVNKDITVTAAFQVTHFNVNFSTYNDFGTITATVAGEEIEPNEYVRRGSQIVFTAVPNEGYQVRAWRNNGIIVSGNATNQYTVNSLNNEINVTVEFQTTHLNVNYSTVNNFGTLVAIVDEEEIPSGSSVLRGKRVIFSAEPDEGSVVKEWKVNNITIPNNTTTEYIISSLQNNTTVTLLFQANFIKVFYDVEDDLGTLIATVNDDEIESGELVAVGAKVVFTATPDEGYKVKEWKNNGTVISDNTSDTFVIQNLNSKPNVTVTFEPEIGICRKLLSKVILYPNPFTNSFTISNIENVQLITITNILGHTVMEISVNNQPETMVETKSLLPGIYIITLQAKNGEKVTHRIVKQ